MDFATTSFWMRHAVQAFPRLEGHKTADAVIVGGGFTGLSAAIRLAGRGYSVVLLERGLVGCGASGRNCGQVGADIGRNLHALRRDLGERNAGKAAGVLRDAIRGLDAFVRENEIDCAYRRTGNVFAGVHPGHTRRVEKVASAASRFGFAHTPLRGHDIDRLGLSHTVACGFLDEAGGTLDPARLVRGMARVAGDLPGVEIYEMSEVREIREGTRLKVRTKFGSVEAPIGVLATNAYSGRLGYLRNKLLPVSVSVAVTRPLTAHERERLGWDDSVSGLYTAHNVLENLRLTSDGRLLVGTRHVRRGFGQLAPKANDARVFAELRRAFRQRFGYLGDIPFDTGWTGRVAITSDSVPVAGALGRERNLYYSAGYSGHGIAMASHAGTWLTRLIEGEPLGEADVLASRRVLPFPPEPLKWLASGLMLATWHGTDRWLDARHRGPDAA